MPFLVSVISGIDCNEMLKISGTVEMVWPTSQKSPSLAQQIYSKGTMITKRYDNKKSDIWSYADFN